MPSTWVLERLYPLVDSQLGYVTAAQAAELGVDRRYLAHHVDSGNLERVARGIYRLRRYPIQRFEDVMVAVLWVGDGAVASHDTALAVYGLADAMPAVIHISVDRRFRGHRRGVLVHHTPLPEHVVTLRHDIPITTPVRTIVDVAADPAVAVAATRDAWQQGLITAGDLEELTAELPDLAESLATIPS